MLRSASIRSKSLGKAICPAGTFLVDRIGGIMLLYFAEGYDKLY
jgi:hypothetical protein